MKSFRFMFLASFLVLCGLLSGVSQASSGLLDKIPLEWKPTDKAGVKKSVNGSDVHAVMVAPFTDLREKPEKIGERIIARGYTQKVTTKDNVAKWLTERIADVFGQYGMDVVKGDGNTDSLNKEPRALGGPLNIEVDIIRFYAVEKTILVSVYDADVELRWRLKATNGDVLWEGTTHGETHRGGRSFNAENYLETLSDATMEAVDNLMRTEAFMLALKNIPSPGQEEQANKE